MKKLLANQKKYLKSISENQAQLIQIGKEGLTDNMITHLNNSLNTNELLKIKIIKNSAENVKDIANYLAEKLDCNILRIIGRTVLVYRESRTKEDDEKIDLP